MQVRRAEAADAVRLLEIDRLTHSASVSPGPDGRDDAWTRDRLADLLVAEEDDNVVGYLMLGHPTPLESNRHVLQIQGLAVDPGHQGRGIGHTLLEAALAHARVRGAHKLSLRVLSTNTTARQLYAALGFQEEGVLREEFVLRGRYVDDVLMARRL